jgi:hypothetical protein
VEKSRCEKDALAIPPFGVEFLGRDNIPLPQVGQTLDPRKNLVIGDP